MLLFAATCLVMLRSPKRAEDAKEPPEPTTENNEATDNTRAAQQQAFLEQEYAKLGGEHYKPLKSYMDYPGIDEPRLYSLDEANLKDTTPIIGIEHNGEAIAFVEEKMKDPKAHVVNVNVGGEKSFSITYCYLANCVRVFESESTDLIQMGVGGLDEDDQLVLLQDGVRYSQTSKAIPLADYPHHRTSLGAWRMAHPTTRVCIPPSRVQIQHRRRLTVEQS